MAKVIAPFTPEQVVYLEIWQHVLNVHPYTCGNVHDGDNQLIPTEAGWKCPVCDYTQDWCHDYSCVKPEFEVPTNPVMYKFSKISLELLREIYQAPLAASFLNMTIEKTPRLAIMMSMANDLKTVIDQYEFSHGQSAE